MERTFRKSVDSLPQIFEFLAEFTQGARIGPGPSFAVQLAVEEIFVNMVKYNREAAHDVRIQLRRDGEAFHVYLIDYDVEPFDVTCERGVNTHRPIHERTPGGLGLHLVKNLMDDVVYEYADRTSTVKLIKYLET